MTGAGGFGASVLLIGVPLGDGRAGGFTLGGLLRMFDWHVVKLGEQRADMPGEFGCPCPELLVLHRKIALPILADGARRL